MGAEVGRWLCVVQVPVHHEFLAESFGNDSKARKARF